jgi:mycothiol system anti-sigma-R factor
MDCEKALREVGLFLDGELEPTDIEELRRHFEGCPPCGDRADFSRRLKELIARKCGCTGVEVPDSLRARVEAFLRPEDEISPG